MEKRVPTTYYDNAKLGFLNDVLLFLQKYFRLFVILGSLACSVLFVAVKGSLLSTVNIDVTAHMGQVKEGGVHDGRYYFGDYTLQTNNLIRNGSFIDEDGKVLNRYVPIYPLMLYGTYLVGDALGVSPRHSMPLLPILLIALSSLIICELAFLLYQNRLLALSAGLIFATMPYILQGLTKTMSVTPFMTFLYLSILVFFGLLLKSGRKQFLGLLGVGVLLGIAMLIRPIGLFLPLIFAFLYVVFYREAPIPKRIANASAILIAVGLTITPWQLFNYGHGEKILLSSDRVHSIVDGVTFNNNPKKKEQISLPDDVNALALRLSESGAESKGEFFGMVFQELKEEPVPVVKLYAIKAARSWYGAFGQQPSKEWAKLGISLFYILLTIIGIFKLDMQRYPSRVYVVSFLLLTLYFWAMTILVVSMVRYMIPVFGMMAVLIPAILSGEKELARKNDNKQVSVENGQEKLSIPG